MNQNTNKWAVEVASPNVSEACQRIAFSFVYRWPVGPSSGEKVVHTNAKFLVFNPEDKSIAWCSVRSGVQLYVNQIVATFDQLVTLFTNLAESVLRFGNVKVNKQWDVTVADIVTLGSDLFDKVVAEMAKFIGKEVKLKLPRVNFTYTSKSSGRKEREILVTAMSSEGIEGLDVCDGNRYKRFLMDKISGEINFIGFADEP